MCPRVVEILDNYRNSVLTGEITTKHPPPKLLGQTDESFCVVKPRCLWRCCTRAWCTAAPKEAGGSSTLDEPRVAAETAGDVPPGRCFPVLAARVRPALPEHCVSAVPSSTLDEPRFSEATVDAPVRGALTQQHPG